MKYLLLIALLVVAYMLWRHARVERRPPPQPGAGPDGKPQQMVSCAACGVHLPRPDAVTGSDGLPYCSKEHRLRAGG